MAQETREAFETQETEDERKVQVDDSRPFRISVSSGAQGPVESAVLLWISLSI